MSAEAVVSVTIADGVGTICGLCIGELRRGTANGGGGSEDRADARETALVEQITDDEGRPRQGGGIVLKRARAFTFALRLIHTQPTCNMQQY